MNKRTIALVTGGYSGEAVISYKSAESIRKNIDEDKWDCYVIDIRQDAWCFRDNEGKEHPVDRNDFSLVINGKKINFDAILLGLHGTPGEDGKLQGYFDCLNIPYTSCNAATSAITFNKKYTVAVAGSAGINVARSIQLFHDIPFRADDIRTSLSFPVFVKPNNGGSSIGMSKVSDPSKLEAAIEKAFREDNQVLVEEFIEGREFTIGVFKTKNSIIPLPITEIITDNEFFDFEAKYEGASREITPAEVDEIVAGKVRETALNVYRIFNCNGVVRMDFIYNESKSEPFLLEINTVPGQSEASIVPQQVRAMGWTLKDFYSALIEDCLT